MPARPLTYHERSTLFSRLANLYKAGIPLDQALNSLTDNKEKTLNKRASKTAAKISSGIPLHLAGANTKLLDSFEVSLLNSANNSGTLEQTFAMLAEHYQTKAQHNKKIRSRMMLPAFIIMAAAFIMPLPKLIAGNTGLGSYLLSAMGLLLLIMSFFFLLARLPVWIKSLGPEALIRKLIDILALNLPVINNWYRLKISSLWLDMAGLSLGSGISMFDALPLLNESIHSPKALKAFLAMETKIRNGASLTDAVQHNPFISHESRQYINTGESAGRLPAMLEHAAGIEKQSLHLLEEQFSEWLPRIIYVAILLLIASSLVGQNIFSHSEQA